MQVRAVGTGGIAAPKPRLAKLESCSWQAGHAVRYRHPLPLPAGPTNSGKTHTALQRLQGAKSGVYCGPLRLLAMEVRRLRRAAVSDLQHWSPVIASNVFAELCDWPAGVRQLQRERDILLARHGPGAEGSPFRSARLVHGRDGQHRRARRCAYEFLCRLPASIPNCG